jgi:hypothetical protein
MTYATPLTPNQILAAKTQATAIGNSAGTVIGGTGSHLNTVSLKK